MIAIRRIYLYLLTLAGLAMLASGVANLGRILIDVLLGTPAVNTAQYVREGVALWGAVALVGLPVWAVHWRWAQRQAQGSVDERSSTLRRLFVYVVLAGAAWSIGSAAHDLLRSLLELLEQPTRLRGADALAAVVRLLVAGAVWLAYWRVAVADRAAVGERGGSATLRRWYVYGFAFAGFVLMLDGARELVQELWQAAAGDPARGLLATTAGAPSALVGLGLWLAHWRWAPAAMGQAVLEEDRRATLRTVYLFLGLALVVAGTIVGASQLLYYGLARLLGVSRPGGVGGDLLQAAAGPGSVALVYGIAWAYQRYAVRQDARTAEAPRQIGVRRLYTYLVALVSVSALATGAGGLLWTLGDLATKVDSTVPADWWRERIALYATLLIVGLPVWLTHWRPSAVVSAEEAGSLSRRLYTYLALIASALALLGSSAGAIYRLLTLALGEPPTTALTTDLAHALAVAVVAATGAVYHWLAIRADTRRSAAAPRPAEQAPSEQSVLVRLHAADAGALVGALAALEERGVRVEKLGNGPASSLRPG